jgi:hypothetical protein
MISWIEVRRERRKGGEEDGGTYVAATRLWRRRRDRDCLKNKFRLRSILSRIVQMEARSGGAPEFT